MHVCILKSAGDISPSPASGGGGGYPASPSVGDAPAVANVDCFKIAVDNCKKAMLRYFVSFHKK